MYAGQVSTLGDVDTIISFHGFLSFVAFRDLTERGLCLRENMSIIGERTWGGHT